MKQLHIYPTSRALRAINSQYKEQDGFLPTFMRMDEFEQRAILLEDKIQIDSLKRILLLREAASFEAFKDLNLDLSLVRFFTKSDAIFKFFEELASEGVGFDTLANADAYAEFGMHLEILEKLLANYKKLLDKDKYTDKAFIPNSYTINEGFLKAYENIEVHLEGYLSHFELTLLEDISKVVSLTIHYSTSKFNIKMQDRFKSIAVSLENNKNIIFSLTDKKVLDAEENNKMLNAKVYAVEEREEQVAVAFREIEQMVRSGIPPKDIVLVLPDENFKEHFMLFDTHNNLNFAMGYDYSKGRIYKSLDALYRYWQSFDDNSKKLLERYGFELEKIEKISSSKKVKVEEFFALIDGLKLHDSPLVDGKGREIKKKEKFSEHVHEKYLHFTKVLELEDLSLKEWLLLWLKSLSELTIDDVRGGKITVMGVLETRGVSFEGVVIVDFNEDVVPATSSKDQFLNSSVRAFANLPTKNDREALQKQYYKRLLEQASQSSILYSTSDSKLPSKFLYELGLDNATQTKAQLDLLYKQSSKIVKIEPIIVDFDPSSIVWSASRLRTFLECKYKYYHRYILKVQEKELEEMNEGQFLHKVLEKLFDKQSFYGSKEEMQKELNLLIDTMYLAKDAKAEYQKLLWKEKLKGFIDSQLDHFCAGWRVVEREKEFQGEIAGLQFKGRIDRIDQNLTDTLVLDYKSGRVEKEPKILNPDKILDFQMPIYQQLLAGKYQNVSFAYLKILENTEMQEVKHLEERNELLEEHIKALRKSTSFIVQKCEPEKKCRFCEITLLLDF